MKDFMFTPSKTQARRKHTRMIAELFKVAVFCAVSSAAMVLALAFGVR